MFSREHDAGGLRAISACVAGSLLAAVLVVGGPAQAALAAGLAVIPRPVLHRDLSYFKLELRASSTRRDGTIELRNPTSRPMRVTLAPVAGETLSTLGSAYTTPSSRPRGVARWLQIADTRVSLAPGESVGVPLSVAVPAAVTPGDYLAGVSVEQLDQPSATTSAGRIAIASVDRYAIGVEVQVPGSRHPLLQFTGAHVEQEPAGLTFLLLARNSGNVILQGVHGAVTVTRGGHVVVARRIEAGTFVSHTRISYPVTAFSARPSEHTRYLVSAWLRYPGGVARLHVPVTFGQRESVIQRRYGRQPAIHPGWPWWKTAAAIAVVLYCLVTTALLLRRRARHATVAAGGGG